MNSESPARSLSSFEFSIIKAEFEGCDGCAICEAVKAGDVVDEALFQKTMDTESLMQQMSQQVASYKKNRKEDFS